MDEAIKKYPNLSRLTTLLEDISVSLDQTKDTIRESCDLSKRLLRCWYLPSNVELPVCLCSSVPHQKMQTLLQKMEQAVSYTKSINEGHQEVPIPWEEQKDCDKPSSPTPEKSSRIVSRTGLKPALPRSKPTLKPLTSLNGASIRRSRLSVGNKEKDPSPQEVYSPNIDCPLHSSNASQLQPALRQVDLAEALDVKGVPPELVAILRSFHRYVDHHRGVRKKSKSAASFLQRSAVLNEDAETTLAPLRDYAESFKLRQNDSQSLQTCSEEGSNHHSAGLWHPSASDVFKNTPLFLRYRNTESLRSLYSTLQSLQLTHLQLEVAEILLNDIVPQLLKISPSDPVMPLYLKTVTALCAMPPWCMPALVKTTRAPTQTRPGP